MTFEVTAIGVHSLDHFTLTVPDLSAAERFFTAFGLDVRTTATGLSLACFDSRHRSVEILPGPRKQLQEIVFGAFEQDMPLLRSRLEQIGVESFRANNDGSLAFLDLEGIRVRVVAAQKSSPDSKSAPSALHDSGRPNDAGCPPRSKAPRVYPRRFAHALFFTRDVLATVDFYARALGLKLSDEADGKVAFMHGIHGSDHHMIAFGESDGPGLHHTSWDVGSVQEVGLGMDQMLQAGFGDNGWGLGRHVLGSNYFHYARDPWGSYAEYSFDIDFISADSSWQAGHHAPEDAFYLWGPEPPADFATNYESADVRTVQCQSRE